MFSFSILSLSLSQEVEKTALVSIIPWRWALNTAELSLAFNDIDLMIRSRVINPKSEVPLAVPPLNTCFVINESLSVSDGDDPCRLITRITSLTVNVSLPDSPDREKLAFTVDSCDDVVFDDPIIGRRVEIVASLSDVWVIVPETPDRLTPDCKSA